MISIVALLISAALPVVNVFLMCLVGFGLARKGILDGRARQILSQLLFWVFIPSLVFTKLADSVDLSKLATWWILPVNMTISIVMGLAIGWVFARLMNVDHWFRKHFMCSVALGNVGNLPIVLVQSLCSNSNTPYAQLLPNGACEQKGIAYVAFSMWIASTFQYCVAFNMLKKGSGPSDSGAMQLTAMKQAGLAQENGAVVKLTVDAKAPETSGREVRVLIQAGQIESVDDEGELLSKQSQEAHSSEREPLRYMESDHLMGGQSNSETASVPLQEESHGSDSQTQWWDHNQAGHSLRKKKQKEIQRWLRGIPWGSYLNMPTLAAVAGLSVGCISALKLLLYGDSPPLLCLTQSLEFLGGGMIPVMMLILGASLAKGPGNTKLSNRVILSCLLVRLVLMPALGTCIVLAMLKAGLFTPPDPLFLLVLLLCHAPPTAMNLQTVATLNQNGEEEMSALLCWQYLAALVTLPLWMLLFVTITSS